MPFWTCSKTVSDEIPRLLSARSALLQRPAAGILPAAARPQSLFRGLSPLSCGGNAAFGGDPRARYPPLPRPYGSRSAAAGCLTGRPACRRTFRRGGGPAGRRRTHNGPCHRLGTRGTHRRGRIVPADRRGVACDPCRAHPRDQTSAPPFADHRLRRICRGGKSSRRDALFVSADGISGRGLRRPPPRDRGLPRGEPCAPPPLRRTHRARTGAQPLLVQSLCLDRRALAFGGAGVGGRPRRARCGVRPHGIQDDHFPSTLRL